jgi:MFS superfamily sulfate permease-like transporter
VLAALVLNAVISLVDVRYARRLWRVERSEFWLLLLSFVATLALGPQRGLGLGVGASLLWFLIRSTRPQVAVLGRLPGTESYRNVQRFPDAESREDVLILRVDAQFYFVRDVLERSGWLARLRSERRIFLRVHDAAISQVATPPHRAERSEATEAGAAGCVGELVQG